MAIKSTPVEFSVPFVPEQITGPPSLGSSTSFDITALSGFAAYVAQMPETSTFDTVFFKVGSVGAGNSFLARVAIETVTLSNGLPTGRLLSPGASGTIIVQGVADYAVKFASPITVQRGQIFSIVIAAISAGLVNACRFNEFTDDVHGSGFPYCLDGGAGTGTPAVVDAIAPCIGIALTGVSGIPLPHLWPLTVVPPTLSFKSPNIYGNKITVSSTMRASGISVWGNVDTVSSMVILYDKIDAATVLAQVPWYPNVPTTSTSFKHELLFSTPVTITPGTYYLAVSGGTTGVASNTTMYFSSFSNNIWRQASPFGGTNVMYVSCNTAPANISSWTESNTKQVFLGLLVDGLDDGVSGVSGAETSSVFFA
jgi:hypothetical protein